MAADFLSPNRKRIEKLELRISRILYVMIIHLGWMLPSTSSGYLGTRRATFTPPFTLLQTGFTKLHKSPYGLVRFYRTVSPVQHFGYCSLLSVALSIASPLLGVTQHPALRSPDFPHPATNETRPSTQLKSFYYTLSSTLKATKEDLRFW